MPPSEIFTFCTTVLIWGQFEEMQANIKKKKFRKFQRNKKIFGTIRGKFENNFRKY